VFMKKPFIILVFIIITVVILAGTRSLVANEISTSGIALGETQSEIGKLKTENALLKKEILEYSSLSRIASSAAEQGFSESKNNFALKKAIPLALRQ